MKKYRNQEEFENSFESLNEAITSENRLYEQSEEHHWQLEMIKGMLPKLTCKQRRYALLVLDGHSDVEISKILGITRSGVSYLRLRLIHKCRKILRRKRLIPQSFAMPIPHK